MLRGALRLAGGTLVTVPDRIRTEQLDKGLLILLLDDFHDRAGVVVEEFRRRAQGGADPAAHAARESMTRDDVVLHPPGTGLFPGLPVPPGHLALVTGLAPDFLLPTVLLPFKGSAMQDSDIGVVPAFRTGDLLIPQDPIALQDLLVGEAVQAKTEPSVFFGACGPVQPGGVRTRLILQTGILRGASFRVSITGESLALKMDYAHGGQERFARIYRLLDPERKWTSHLSRTAVIFKNEN